MGLWLVLVLMWTNWKTVKRFEYSEKVPKKGKRTENKNAKKAGEKKI